MSFCLSVCINTEQVYDAMTRSVHCKFNCITLNFDKTWLLVKLFTCLIWLTLFMTCSVTIYMSPDYHMKVCLSVFQVLKLFQANLVHLVSPVCLSVYKALTPKGLCSFAPSSHPPKEWSCSTGFETGCRHFMVSKKQIQLGNKTSRNVCLFSGLIIAWACC